MCYMWMDLGRLCIKLALVPVSGQRSWAASMWREYLHFIACSWVSEKNCIICWVLSSGQICKILFARKFNDWNLTEQRFILYLRSLFIPWVVTDLLFSTRYWCKLWDADGFRQQRVSWSAGKMRLKRSMMEDGRHFKGKGQKKSLWKAHTAPDNWMIGSDLEGQGGSSWGPAREQQGRGAHSGKLQQQWKLVIHARPEWKLRCNSPAWNEKPRLLGGDSRSGT